MSIIVGQLYRASTYPDNMFEGTLVEVTRVWDKRIIDPICPMSVEIRTMVTYQYIEGERLGLSKTMPAYKFRRISKPIGSRNIT